MHNRFYVDQLSKLVGYKVSGILSDKDDEFFGLTLRGPSGDWKALWFLQDDEGNGPGSFAIGDIDPADPDVDHGTWVVEHVPEWERQGYERP